MNISGVLVQIAPARVEEVRENILKLRDVEIPLEAGDGRMVVIIEEKSTKASGEVLMTLQTLPGVLSANLVYQHVEEEDG